MQANRSASTKRPNLKCVASFYFVVIMLLKTRQKPMPEDLTENTKDTV